MDDPKENVDDGLENRLDDLSGTLTDDDITTEAGADSQASSDEDADDQDADADDADQDADADDAS